MNETIFTYDMNAEKFKAFVSQKFNGQQLEDIISCIHMYIEIMATEEMNNRIFSNKTNSDTEIQLQWVKDLLETFWKFLKKTWQK